MKIFSERLKKIMTEEHVSGYRLAKEVDVSNQAVCDWLNGKEPKVGNLKKICEFLDVSADYLLGLTNEE